MTHSQCHAEIRQALAGTLYRSFLVTVESLESMSGDLFVEWRVCIFDGGGNAKLHFRGRNPNEILDEVRATVKALAAPPSELEALGAPPSKGAA